MVGKQIPHIPNGVLQGGQLGQRFRFWIQLLELVQVGSETFGVGGEEGQVIVDAARADACRPGERCAGC